MRTAVITCRVRRLRPRVSNRFIDCGGRPGRRFGTRGSAPHRSGGRQQHRSGVCHGRRLARSRNSKHGHHPADAADRREHQPWYTSETEPAFADMAAKLRRTIIAARFTAHTPLRPTDAEIRSVQHAWAQVGLDLTA